MGREYLSFFFALIFLASITMPAMHYIFDNTQETIVLLDLSEEENKESEIAKDAEVKFLEIARLKEALVSLNTPVKDHYYLSLYSRSHGDVTSPPPEFV